MDAVLVTDDAPRAASVLKRIASGDRLAFTELVEAHDADMARLCFVICGDAEQARDAVQNAWHRLWRRPPTLRDETRLRSWLLTVAANEARQMARRRRTGTTLEERALVPRAIPDPGAAIERLDLASALAGLDAAERELLALRYLLELSSAEIAEHLGISAEGARSRLHRLIQRLRQDLDR